MERNTMKSTMFTVEFLGDNSTMYVVSYLLVSRYINHMGSSIVMGVPQELAWENPNIKWMI